MDPAKRALADQKYQQTVAMFELLPQEAREGRFVVFRAKRRSDAKASFRPLEKISASQWKDQNFVERDTLISYLADRYPRMSRWFIEPQDEHGHRLQRIPTLVVGRHSEEDMRDGYEDEDEDFDDLEDEEVDDRPRGRRRRRDYEEDEEERPARANIADLLVSTARADKAAMGTAIKSGNDMMGLMLILQQQQSSQAREDDRRREERLAEEARRREEARREEERKAEERRREEENRRREEENRRRDEENRRRDEEQRRRDEETRRAVEASNKRMELLVGLGTAVLTGIVPKLLDRKPTVDPVQQALMQKLLADKPTDPLMAMLLKNMLDQKPADPGLNAVTMIVEAAKAGTQIQAEQMKAALGMNAEVTKLVVQKAIKALEEGGSGGSGNTMEQILEALNGASEIVNKLTAGNQNAVPQAYAQAAALRQRQAAAQAQAGQQQPGIPAPAAAGAQPAPAVPTGAPPAAAPTPEQQTAEEQQQREFEEEVRKDPIVGVLSALHSIQTQQFGDQNGYQQLVIYMMQHMPLGVRVAILDDNQEHLLAQVLPTIQRFPTVQTWVMSADVQKWLQEYIPTLKASIEAMYGPAAKQREEYIDLVSKAQALAEQQQAAAAAAAAAQPEQPAPASEPASEEPAPASEPASEQPEETERAAEVIPGPGAAPATSGGSHLDDEV